MSDVKFQLAQLNIARAKSAMDSEQMRGFVERIDAINAIADRAPGFVWRLTDADLGLEGGVDGALAIRAFDDPNMLVNMSVWESLEALHHFVLKTAHAKIMARRAEWFDRLESVHLCLWWVEAGRRPDLEQAKAKLAMLQDQGPTPEAFSFRNAFDENGDPVTIKE